MDILQVLFAANKKLTFKNAVRRALATEAASKSAKGVKGREHNVSKMHTFHPAKKPPHQHVSTTKSNNNGDPPPTTSLRYFNAYNKKIFIE